ncbi:MAG TPA: glycosyltransferase [Firmicutes bacterium]|jgi:polyisoprenyl-phosphate glycosyltransferase|nr:glycosyltransferase [Bacillota bacterium]
MKQRISIVVPVFNEEKVIDAFYQEMFKSLKLLPYDYELLFVDDGSTDATPMILDRITNANPKVRAFILSKNFGHQFALTCGLDHADGDAVITMDGDMQHPPAMLPELIAKWEAGFEIVQTIRLNTIGVSWFKRFTSNIFYKIINAVSQVEIKEGMSDFRLMDRKVVESFRKFRERTRFIRGLMGLIGYKQATIEFVAPKRLAGQSKFSLKKMWYFALDGITSFSNFPLRLSLYVGLLTALTSFILTLHILYVKIFTNEAIPGWATLGAGVFFFIGIQFIFFGIIGEYVARIFDEIKQRPLYFIKAELRSDTLGAAHQPNKLYNINKQ